MPEDSHYINDCSFSLCVQEEIDGSWGKYELGKKGKDWNENEKRWRIKWKKKEKYFEERK